MKPEVQAAIESRRQWFWVWTLGLISGLGFAIVIQALRNYGFTHWPSIVVCLSCVAALRLFILSLKLHRPYLAWTVSIAATSGFTLTVLAIAIDSILEG